MLLGYEISTGRFATLAKVKPSLCEIVVCGASYPV